MPSRFTPYTEREIERAIALKAEGLTWAEAAEEMGRPAGSLMVTVSLYRRGLRSPAQQAKVNADINAILKHAVTVEGVTSLKVLSHRVGRSVDGTCRRLQDLGLDHRTRLIAAHTIRQRRMAGQEVSA